MGAMPQFLAPVPAGLYGSTSSRLGTASSSAARTPRARRTPTERKARLGREESRPTSMRRTWCGAQGEEWVTNEGVCPTATALKQQHCQQQI